MKKLSLLSTVFIVTSTTGAINSSALGVDAPISEIDSLRQNVVYSFLQSANTPTTELHKKLEQFNQNNTDGRNQNGVLPKTLSATNLQVILMGGENQFGRYCSQIEGKPGRSRCENGISATYLILIPYGIAVHKAVEYNSLQFLIKASKKVDWEIDEQEKQYNRHESIEIGKPVEASIQTGRV